MDSNCKMQCKILSFRLPELQGKSATAQDAELSVRKLFRMAVHRQYFADNSRHPKTVSIMQQLLGPDIKLLQSMALLKPPGITHYVYMKHSVWLFLLHQLLIFRTFSGSDQKKWHQDNAYFRLTPASIVVRIHTVGMYVYLSYSFVYRAVGLHWTILTVTMDGKLMYCEVV